MFNLIDDASFWDNLHSEIIRIHHNFILIILIQVFIYFSRGICYFGNRDNKALFDQN